MHGQQVIALHAAGGFGLHDHALHAPLVGEVVHIAGAQGGGQGAIDGIKAHAQRIGFVAVNVDLQLRCILQTIGAHLGQHLALHGHAQQLVAGIDQGIVACAIAVLQAEGKAGGVAQLRDGGRVQGEDKSIAHPGHGPHDATGQGIGRMRSACALVPGLQGHKGQAHVLPFA